MLNQLQHLMDCLEQKKTRKLIASYTSWLRKVVNTIPNLIAIAPADKWEIKKLYRSANDMLTCSISPIDTATSFILYIPKSRLAHSNFEKRKAILALLQKEEKLEDWRDILPQVLYEGKFQRQLFWIEECLPGLSGIDVMQNAENRQLILHSAINIIGYLHQKTERAQIVGETLLNKWVFEPLEEILSSRLIYVFRHSRSILKELGANLEKELHGKYFSIGWVHGDFWPGNILVDVQDSQVVGLVDWEDFEMDFPLSLDLVNMMVSMRRIENEKELGAIVVDLLKEEVWRPHEQVIWDREEEKLNGNYVNLREALLLFWLHHIAIGLKKSWRYAVNPLWVYGNFVTVLKFLKKNGDIIGI